MGIQFITIQLTIPALNKETLFRIKVTQRIFTSDSGQSFNIGHYSGYIENDKGDIITSFESLGAPKERIDIPFVIEEFNRIMARM